MHVLARLCGAIVQLFSDLARRKFFSMRGVFLPRIFCGGVGGRFTTDFHGFWARIFTVFYGGGGIILGSMSEKIVGIFIIKKITFSTIRVALSDRAVQRRVIYGGNSQ